MRTKSSSRKYLPLRHLMEDADVDIPYIAAKTGKSVTYFQERFAGRRPWGLDDVENICKMLNIALSEIPDYFIEHERGGKTIELRRA